MKKHLLLLGVLLVLSCNSDDNATTSEPQAPVAENPEGILVVYKVLSNGNLEVVKDDYPTNTIVNESYQQDLDKHQEMWNLVKKIFPQYYLNSLSNLHIFSAVASENQYTAYVNFDDDRSKMTLGLAVDFAYFSLFDAQKYFTTTIIHEFPRISKSEGLMRKIFKTGRVSVMQKPVVIRVEKPSNRMRAIVISEHTVHV